MSEEEYPPPRHVDWRDVKKSFALFLGAAVLGNGAVAYHNWSLDGFYAAEAALLCLALGFWITERIIAVFTRTRVANATAIGLLLSAKIGWWGGLFFLSRNLPSGLEAPIALGIGFFLAALFAATLRHYGMPRISDGEPPSSP